MVTLLLDLPKNAILQPGWWASSPPVRRLQKPERPVGKPSDISGLWVDALNALTNAGAKTLDYDDWRNVVFAIHHETEGSDDGLALAHEFSSRSGKHDPDFLDNRVWPYITAGGGITGRSIMSLAARLEGWSEPLDDSDFPMLVNNVVPLRPGDGSGAGRPGDSVGSSASAGGAVLRRASDAALLAALEPVERRGVPPAKHLCTDQANAARLVKAYGSRVLVAAGHWHVWDGKRWKAEEGEIYRFACQLSAMVKEEARTLLARAKAAAMEDGGATRVDRAGKTAEALEKWSSKCEMKGTIEAAIGLARKMLTVDAGDLDRDPWLLNVRNGIVDLRDGTLGPHRAELLMTRLVDVDYKPDAVCAEWERTLGEIVAGDEHVVSFLQRWFGYCLTAWTREQVFVVHWGDGGNGKSTVLDLMARTLGDYAGVAAPGLLAGTERGGERHPTEVASLRGRRMVTAHETREGVALREEVVKSMTGDDMMTARYMREDFFEFRPTHKIQLLTNHKPQIKGQDRGIWRRVMLVAYGVTFGSPEEVAKGEAMRPRDVGLLERLGAPEALEGILAWRVRGAVSWAESGLRAPDAVLDANARYQGEQDRVRQFVGECCEIDEAGAGWKEPLTLGMGGLYPAYQGWCKDAGYFALGRGRFVDEIKRVVRGCRVVEAYGKGESGARRKITQVEGLRLLPE